MRRNFMKLSALAAMLAMMGSPVAGMNSSHSSNIRTTNKDAIKGEDKPVAGISKKMLSGGSPFAHPKTDFSGNQRQYRKKCRQNPCRYNSYKHRGNN